MGAQGTWKQFTMGHNHTNEEVFIVQSDILS